MKKLSDTCRTRKTVMCLRPHCGQRVRTVYLAPDFAGSGAARDNLMFVLNDCRKPNSLTRRKQGVNVRCTKLALLPDLSASALKPTSGTAIEISAKDKSAKCPLMAEVKTPDRTVAKY